jgi:hypothetical protein
MAFTVETGAGLANANAYVTAAEFIAFFADRGDSVATELQANIEAAIIRATDYIDKRFGPVFKGEKEDEDNGLEWPRLNAVYKSGDVIPSDVIPNLLKKATYEYAKIALYMALLPVPTPNFNPLDPATGETTVNQGGSVIRTREVVGPIEDEKWFSTETWRLESQRAAGVYSNVSSVFNLPEYPVADEWLRQLIRSGQGTSLSRA